MDYLWSPWRYQYVQKEHPADGCIFCRIAAEQNDAENLVVYRGNRNFVMLNMFPYTTGHVMIVPYEHVDNLTAASAETLQEMILLAQQAQHVSGVLVVAAPVDVPDEKLLREMGDMVRSRLNGPGVVVVAGGAGVVTVVVAVPVEAG